MTTATETAEQIAILEEVLDLFDQAAELPRLPRNPRDRGLLPRRPRRLATRLVGRFVRDELDELLRDSEDETD